jgi:hypothetical protein
MEQKTELLKAMQEMMETHIGFLVSQIDATQAKTDADLRDMREENDSMTGSQDRGQ